MKLTVWPIAALLFTWTTAWTDGPADNLADKVRSIPPPGIAVPAADRAELEAGLAGLTKQVDDLRAALKDRPGLLDLLPDVEIYANAVRYALAYNEFFSPKEIGVAKAILKQGSERAAQLRDGKAPWTSATGLVTRGYVSRIDGSVQPYGLTVPASYLPGGTHAFRLDVWLHGRVENLSEVNFLDGWQRSPGDVTPPHAFVLHPYGRYCNANRFAGEVDVLEGLAHVKKHYPIDANRLVMRGFSMGGAGCWQFATHHAGLWAAAAPGAGFSETADFLKVFQNESVKPAWYESRLWHLYNSTDYALNLFNCPTVAYSGAIDKQKQAADQMAEALKAEGMTLVHLIGPKTGHAYHPEVKQEIIERIDQIAARGRDPLPRQIRFTTWTLRYNEMLWLTVDGLGQHWDRARVDADLVPDGVQAKTVNVTGLTFTMGPGLCPFAANRPPKVRLDGQDLEAAPVLSDRSWTAHFRKTGDQWAAVPSAQEDGVQKRHGLQGPIDDAFLDSFVMVKPTGKPLNEAVGKWVDGEMAHAIDHWRKHFRGEARVLTDDALTDADIANHNLILWGDPSSNRVLARIAAKLPVLWNAEGIHVDAKTYPSADHVAVQIYPNPLNPNRYVVLNSGFTYREYDYLNNARQTPKLPDYAVLDVKVPRSSRSAGGVVAAGFFGEKWELKEPAR